MLPLKTDVGDADGGEGYTAVVPIVGESMIVIVTPRRSLRSAVLEIVLCTTWA